MPMRPARALASERGAAVTAQDGGSGPGATLERLYREEGPGLSRFFRRRLREGDDAPDMVQEAFLRLAAFMARKTVADPTPYLQRIARNLLFERSRRRARHLAMFHVPLDEGSAPGVSPEQHLQIEERDVLRIYQLALGELPEKTRSVFLLHRVEELTYREIGERLGISVPTVQYHFARSLAHIDAALQGE